MLVILHEQAGQHQVDDGSARAAKVRVLVGKLPQLGPRLFFLGTRKRHV
jgi:hypothetical protein